MTAFSRFSVSKLHVHTTTIHIKKIGLLDYPFFYPLNNYLLTILLWEFFNIELNRTIKHKNRKH